MSTTASTSAAGPSNANAFLEAVKTRRTAYAINSESPIPDARIQEIVETAVKHCPVRYCAREGAAGDRILILPFSRLPAVLL